MLWDHLVEKERKTIHTELEKPLCLLLNILKFLYSWYIFEYNKKIKKPYQRAKNESKGYNFLLAIDGSKTSLNMLKYAKDLARNTNDRVQFFV